MIKKLPVLFLLLIIPFVLTACTLQDIPVIGGLFGGGVSNEPVALNFWGLWENSSVMNSMAENYKTLKPLVTVNYDDRSVLGADSYKERVYARLDEPNDLDIVMIHNSWVKDLASVLTPLPSDLMSPTQYSDMFYPVATESATVEGSIYAVPAYYDGLVLVYNREHFEEIDQLEAPTSWEEFRRLAIDLTIRGDEDTILRGGAAIGTANNIDFFSDILGLLFSQVGAEIPDDLNSTAAQDTLLFYTDFVKEYGVWDNSFEEASAAFADEKVSMIFVPTWNLLDIINARPDLDIGVAPVPQALESNPTSWGSFWMYAVPSSSPNKKAAWEYLNYLVSPEQQQSMYTASSQYRQYGSPYASTTLSSQLLNDPYVGPALESAPYAKSSILAGRSGNVTAVNAMQDAVNAILEDTNDTVSPATVLRIAQGAMSQSN